MDDGISRYNAVSTYTNGLFSLAVDPANPNVVYADTLYDGAYASTDGAVSWSALNDGMPDGDPYRPKVDALAVNPHDGYLNAVLGGVDGGYYQLDADEGWRKINTDLTLMSVSHIHFEPTSVSRVHVSGGLTRDHMASTDGGITWQQKLGHPDSGDIGEIAFHP